MHQSCFCQADGLRQSCRLLKSQPATIKSLEFVETRRLSDSKRQQNLSDHQLRRHQARPAARPVTAADQAKSLTPVQKNLVFYKLRRQATKNVVPNQPETAPQPAINTAWQQLG